MAKMLTTCPSCRHSLAITELTCPHCHITIRGQFESHPSLELTEEQMAFLKVFVVSRGNLKEIERILGISYPTVRSKLDQLVEVFQPDTEVSITKDRSADRRHILEQIQSGKLGVAEGLKLLQSGSMLNDVNVKDTL
ncbi:MAG: DUF2089 domain-containing protein [Firmicutes bacterium]|jgi:hypothetical protein|nr:DUF2089 domain-containing protein [Bacillota bacterium]MCL5971292.1 DUF2089 domain-containing protein [Bacillota bacterium]